MYSIEAVITFKEGVQTHLTINVEFSDCEDGQIGTRSKIGFIQFNEEHERLPSYMHVLGRYLKKYAEEFWDQEGLNDKEIIDLKL